MLRSDNSFEELEQTLNLRERPFDFLGGGGGRKTSQKKFWRWFQGKKFSGPKGRQKKSAFRTP